MPRTEEPGKPQSIESQRIGHDSHLVTKEQTNNFQKPFRVIRKNILGKK